MPRLTDLTRAIILAAALLPFAAHAQQAAPDKSGFTLFDPTPDALLRDLSTDRPGKSHSAITVDAGHIQIETDFWNDSFDHWSTNQVTTRETIYGDPNLKLGLTNWAELDTILPVYETLEQRSRAGAGIQRASGLGDLQLGGKVNFWGNDPPPNAPPSSSFGLIGFVKLPTAAAGLGNNMVEAIVNTPYVTSLPANFSFTVEPGLGLMREASKQGYAADYQVILNLNHPVLSKTVTAAIELFLDRSTDHNTGTRDTIDPSLQWQIGKNLQLDVGAYFGITKAAADINPYVGVSYRY